MSFAVPADVYARFMGRFSEPLAVAFAEYAGLRAGQTALDVGSGPGALTTQLVDRLGADAVAAVDPSPPFVAALRARLPDVDVRAASAEDLPFPDDAFDATLAELVVHFMSDPVAGLREMARVTRPGGVVAACVWDHDGGRSPLSTCWQAATELDPDVVDEAGLAGAREGHLEELCAEAGLRDVESTVLSVDVVFDDFDTWWHPYTNGVGPLGDYLRSLDESRLEALRSRCAELVLPTPFTIRGSAWTVRARA
ncbi:SAM-dependent methyltransferase [Nocardioides sp. Root1257]|uniref:class I SAM-dependent methyltransferase n=1 Tax=unclassified Nocardioides TaxID=2615069 RepID=UPI000700364A|nr:MULTISPECIES: class I SAM-dependent methyltransferase [unclassified Nocardioides]KQW52973.1 SAM-dependent methyltransferase [Nocardioides sp. Root1257]KRC55661.1 SAM-dependent methyltransferase [Nocardioides sp. Root224]